MCEGGQKRCCCVLSAVIARHVLSYSYRTRSLPLKAAWVKNRYNEFIARQSYETHVNGQVEVRTVELEVKAARLDGGWSGTGPCAPCKVWTLYYYCRT